MSIPFYVIAAGVPAGNRVLRFHGISSDSAAHLLTDVERFRWAGFDVAIPDQPHTGPDGSLELKGGDRKLLRLFQDGTLIFRARADHDFMGWGFDPATFAKLPRLNPVVAVELHTSFVFLYRRVLERLKTVAESVRFDLSLRGGALPTGKRLFLTEYFKSGTVDWAVVPRFQVQEDPADATRTVPARAIIEQPCRVAYQLVKDFADLFDFPHEAIPFTRDSTHGTEVDIESIRALR